jgi:DNA-binding response OmpR family regulator
MRLLSLNIDKELISKLQNENFYICDNVEDLDDAVYHCEVRYYNLVLINCDNFNSAKLVLKQINPRHTAVVVFSKNYNKDFEIELLKAGAIVVMDSSSSSELILAKLETIHRENFQEKFMFKDKYIVNTIENSVTDENNNKLVMKGKPFNILMYLIKNRHRSSISKDEILDVIWDEPEWVVKNVVEVNINIIRKGIKDTFEDDFINTIRHRGYQVV